MHSLSNSYTFLFQSSSKDKTAWQDSQKSIGGFESVEVNFKCQEFWAYYQHLEKLDQLPLDCGFQVFKNPIKPMWEDEANQNGGRFLLRVKKNYANYFWENLILWLIGQSSSDVCGLVSNVKEHEVLISIWVKNVQ